MYCLDPFARHYVALPYSETAYLDVQSECLEAYVSKIFSPAQESQNGSPGLARRGQLRENQACPTRTGHAVLANGGCGLIDGVKNK